MFINVDTANEKAVNILQNAHVYLTGIATAKDVIPFLAQDKALPAQRSADCVGSYVQRYESSCLRRCCI